MLTEGLNLQFVVIADQNWPTVVLFTKWFEFWDTWMMCSFNICVEFEADIECQEDTEENSPSRFFCLMTLRWRLILYSTCCSLSGGISPNHHPPGEGTRSWSLWEVIRSWGLRTADWERCLTLSFCEDREGTISETGPAKAWTLLTFWL